jgi:hypothetical protein
MVDELECPERRKGNEWRGTVDEAAHFLMRAMMSLSAAPDVPVGVKGLKWYRGRAKRGGVEQHG